MASVLWLDFDSVALSEPLTPRFIAEFGSNVRQDTNLSPEERVISAVEASGLTDDEISDFVARGGKPTDGLIELWDWAHWNGWHMAVGGVTFDLLLDPVIDDAGLDRVARHCGRTEMLYRRQVRFLSPRGVEIRSNFAVAYLNSYRSVGDLVVYVGNDAHGAGDAEAAQVAIAGPNLAEALAPAGYSGELRLAGSLGDVRERLEKEAHLWQASFSSTTAAGG